MPERTVIPRRAPAQKGAASPRRTRWIVAGAAIAVLALALTAVVLALAAYGGFLFTFTQHLQAACAKRRSRRASHSSRSLSVSRFRA